MPSRLRYRCLDQRRRSRTTFNRLPQAGGALCTERPSSMAARMRPTTKNTKAWPCRDRQTFRKPSMMAAILGTMAKTNPKNCRRRKTGRIQLLLVSMLAFEKNIPCTPTRTGQRQSRRYRKRPPLLHQHRLHLFRNSGSVSFGNGHIELDEESDYD